MEPSNVDNEGLRFVAQDSFPYKLHAMLDDVDVHSLSFVVSWQPHGRCFVVHKRKEFVEHIMPMYFRMSKFSSFQRQLCLYGFSRLTTGQDKRGYYHEFFLRGRKDLCRNMRRQQVKGTCVRQPSLPEKDPNFYLMDYMPALSHELQGKPMAHDTCVATSAASSSLPGVFMPFSLASSQQQTFQPFSLSSMPFPSTSISVLEVASTNNQLQQLGSTTSIMPPSPHHLHSLLASLNAATPNSFSPAAYASWPYQSQPFASISSTTSSLQTADQLLARSNSRLSSLPSFECGDDFLDEMNGDDRLNELLDVSNSIDDKPSLQHQESDETFDAVLKALSNGNGGS